MTRKPGLAAALRQSSTPATAARVAPPAADQGQRPPSRQGKKTVAGHFDPAVSRQLRELALSEDSSVQDLLREALNDLFEKRGKARIA